MVYFKLLPGAELRYLSYPMPKPENVAPYAHKFLFEEVELTVGVKLKDVFALFEACPLLKDVLQRSFAESVLAEAAMGPLPVHQTPVGPVEFLRLQQTWHFNSATREYDWSRIELCAIGPVLSSDAPDEGLKAGERVAYGVSAASVRRYLDLPLVLDPEIRIQESDPDAKHWHQVVDRVRKPNLTLGELLNAIFGELTMHGGPKEAAELFKCIRQQVSAYDSGASESAAVSGSELFGNGDQAANAEMFAEQSQYIARDIETVLRDIEDADNAAEVLERNLPGIVVKAAYRALSGREFRRAHREAGRSERMTRFKERMASRKPV